MANPFINARASILFVNTTDPITADGTDLTIENLAYHLKISSRELSFLINYNTSSNFKNYINKLRINYVIAQLHTNAIKEKTIHFSFG